MAASLLNRISVAIQRIEQVILVSFGSKTFPPPDAFCVSLANSDLHRFNAHPKKITISDIIKDGFQWAVPHHRRSVEKRLKRKFGHPEYHFKLLLPKQTLRVCNVCGDDHEVGVLCPTCYKRVIDETTAMQDAIQNELALNPVEKEVVVLYDGEREEKPAEFWEGKRIVEIKKPRPAWFSRNVLQRTTQQPATTSDVDVKPSQLG